jgi:serine/threonine-protein kinase
MATYQPGSVVCGGRFRVLRVLAIGGMGSVYDVEDTALGRAYVLKTMHGELAGEDELRRQMRREARVLGHIDHPNIVRIFTAGVTDDLPFIVMEKLQGATLRDVLRTGASIPMRAAVRVAGDILLALDHVHELGIVHCDVKPENIFLAVEHDRIVPKLLDFGVVRVLTRGEATVKRGGTVRYASPEQVRGDAVGPRSDIYSLALVLYEMLAGKGPFHGVVGATHVAEAQLTQTPRRIAGVPSSLMTLLLSALAKDESVRPCDAFMFARALRDYEALLGHDDSLEKALAVTCLACEETTRRPANDTVVDLSCAISSDDLLTGFAGSRPTETPTAAEGAATGSFRRGAAEGPRAPLTRDTR